MKHQPMPPLNPPAGTQISCCICLNLTGDRIPAVTLIHGYAVCSKHTDLVSQPEFDIFLFHASKPGQPV